MFKLDNLNDCVQFFKRYWFEQIGLVVLLIVISVTTATLLIQGKAPWRVIIFVIALFDLFVYLAWWFSRKLTRTPKNKVGFLVSISCENDTESRKLREDFIVPLRQFMKGGEAGNVFHFIELPQYIANGIVEKDDADALRRRCRGHFMLYGRVRLRTINGQDHHYIELDGIVAHKPIPNPVSQMLAREFTELLPNKVLLPTKNDLFSFQFTSEWAATVAKYIIGLAAAYSGDLDYAEKLYTNAEEQLQSQVSNFPIYKLLMERLPTRKSELYEVRAMVALKSWGRDHDPNHIYGLGEYLLKVDKSRRQTVPIILHLRAIHAFLGNRDVDGAIKILKRINAKNDGLWHCNMAFLLAYGGTLRGL